MHRYNESPISLEPDIVLPFIHDFSPSGATTASKQEPNIFAVPPWQAGIPVRVNGKRFLPSLHRRSTYTRYRAGRA